jgi:glucose-6-phosphate isomerase/transaldolase/glucose-6-phosphate isomerase
LVRQVTQSIDPARSLFILASKSGGTIEVMSLFAHFWERVHQTPGHQGGEQFLAITDPGTGLEKKSCTPCTPALRPPMRRTRSGHARKK